MQDVFDVDDSRTMDADKTNWIELAGKLVQRGPVQQFLSSDVQVRINPDSFDPVDICHPYEAGGSGLRYKSSKLASSCCRNAIPGAPRPIVLTSNSMVPSLNVISLSTALPLFSRINAR